ncbi:MAG: four-carbon acid sugar kinase family protein [Candidatus Sumerlaeota bacterium]
MAQREKYALLADDLSGALEVGAAFYSIGLRTRVVLQAADGSFNTADSGFDCLVYDTESRHKPEAEALNRVEKALQAIDNAGRKLIYKKIDSTLRGHLAAELLLLQKHRPEQVIIVNPANPKAGRTVQGGVLYVHGKAVAETDFAHDPMCPINESRIDRILRHGGFHSMTALDLRLIRSGQERLTRFVEHAAGEGMQLALADCVREADMHIVARAAGALKQDAILVGSGGMAHALAATFAATEKPKLPTSKTASTPPLYIIGSPQKNNREQARELAKTYGLPICPVKVGEDLRADSDDAEVGLAKAEEISAALTSSKEGAIFILDQAGSEKLDATRLIRFLGELVQTVHEKCGLSRLFLTGGETAREVLERFQISRLEIAEEIEEGVVGALARGDDCELRVVIKPGGFGSASSLLRVHAWLWHNMDHQTERRGT